MNLHLLRIFHAVAELRSFSRAGEALFISQPAVSKGVRELERQLDVPLIERGAHVGRGVKLTESGAALAEHARGIFALERAAAEDLRARVELRQGRLLLGASTTIAAYWLPPYLATFARQFPGIELQVRVGNTRAIGAALIGCEIDLALVEGPLEDARLTATHWRDDELQIIVHPQAALVGKRRPTVAQLNANVWLLREPGSGTREVTERMLRAQRIVPARTIELGSNEAIARAAAAGLGVAMLPAHVVQELTRLGELAIVQNPSTGRLLRPLFVLQLRQRPQSQVVRAFREVLRERA
ncbi:MAG TPA: LysR family transcriptional regulator [Steroidobacteraceae bacterium]|nr:LysR family transcriptional regulator [Steroidobacteraceae bacterium]